MSRLLFRYVMSFNLQVRVDKYNLTNSRLDFRKSNQEKFFW